ncbi:MAG TPA: terminase TerL endonuclease subunit [Vicinamibacterales bacterium]|nr:terminase TerL endonuclease subunit [Vicinamibacterales bacterium]
MTRYATDVVAGTIVAGRLVRLACQRHLDDLRDAATKGLEWRPGEAQRVIDFFPAILRLPEQVDVGGDDEVIDDDDDDGDGDDGEGDDEPEPFVLSPFQQFIAGSLFGWYKRNGRRRFRFAYVETGKGSGKTPFGVGLMLYRCVADGERRAQIYFAATKLDQAKIPFADAVAMVDASPSLRKRFIATVNNLAMPSTGSFIRAISSEKKGLDGKRVSSALLEELHEHPTADVVQKVRKGIKGRPNALILEITNAGFDRNSICWDHHELSRQVLEGTVVNDRWFAFVAQLDACDRCHAEGKLQPQDGCPTCDDWRVEGPHWLKPNPNLGVSLPWSQLREEVNIAIAVPSEQNMTKRLNFGIWTDQVTVWLPVNQWAECKGTATAASLLGRECYVGIDVSSKIDLTAVSLLFPKPIEDAGDLAVDLGPDWKGEQPHDRPDERRTLNLNCAFDIVTEFWLPKQTLIERVKDDKVPYDQWEREGWLRVTTGNIVDQDEILDFLVKDIAKKYRVLGFGYDPKDATQLALRLQQHFGPDRVTEVPQGFRQLSEPSKVFEALVRSGRANHDGNKVLAWNVANVGKEENKWGDIRPVKLHQRKRIDGVVAAIIGLRIWMLNPPPKQSVYATRGAHVIRG